MKTSEEIIKDASNKEKIDDYSLLEMHLYLVIKQILKMYFNNQITKKEANIYKQKAVKKYEMDKRQYDFEKSLFQEHIQILKNTEMQRIELRKFLNENKEITEERLCEGFNLVIEILNIVFKKEFI